MNWLKRFRNYLELRALRRKEIATRVRLETYRATLAGLRAKKEAIERLLARVRHTDYALIDDCISTAENVARLEAKIAMAERTLELIEKGADLARRTKG